jgi:transposase
MTGRSPVSATDDQRVALTALAGSRDRGEADRARAVLLTLAGWTSPHIAEAFGVREDTVRLWRSDFMRDGAGALKANVAPGPAPVKSEAALRVATPLLEAPVADRRNWTIARLRAEIASRHGPRTGWRILRRANRRLLSLSPPIAVSDPPRFDPAAGAALGRPDLKGIAYDTSVSAVRSGASSRDGRKRHQQGSLKAAVACDGGRL